MKGLDISFAIPPQSWWEARRAEGYKVMVQDLWTGGFASNAGILAAASTNLKRARLAGFEKRAGYANASPPDWWSINIQMGNIRLNAGDEWGNLTDVVVDAEIPGITQARVMELADGLEAAGKVADVLYTAPWFWNGHMGNSTNIAWRRFRLWNADYDGDPTIDFPRPYGPWRLADLIGKQYAGTTRIDGHAVDLNTFKDEWLSGTHPPPAPPVEPPTEEDELMGKIADRFAQLGKDVEAEIAAKAGATGPRGPQGPKGDTGPMGPPGPAGGGTAQRTYTVKSGDSLGVIASKYSGVSWQQIYEANKATIGNDPDLITPGMVLVIP